MTELTVENLAVDAVLAYPGNARVHGDLQIEQLKESIRQFGFNVPCLIDQDGVLVAGHGRVMAAQALGMTTVPVLRLNHLSPAQVKAYRLADNRIALNSEWDEEKLAQELAELSGDFVLEDLGFDDADLDRFLEDEGAADAGARDGEDEAPDVQAVVVAAAGDVWLLGGHRVVCGSSTDKAAVEACVGRDAPHLMVTDPPYGVEYDANWRNEADRANGKALGARAIGKVENDNRADWREAWALFRGDVAYVWHADKYSGVVEASLAAADFELRCQIIWAKNNFAIGRGDYHWKHEPCWYAVRRNRGGHWQGDRTQATVWDIPKPQRSETGHSTQKPVECMRRPIVNNSARGEAVYDPFLGSGTTLIAAETEGRRCLGIELNPAYVDVTIRRWQEMTGQAAVLQATGQSFAQVEVARAGREAA